MLARDPAQLGRQFFHTGISVLRNRSQAVKCELSSFFLLWTFYSDSFSTIFFNLLVVVKILCSFIFLSKQPEGEYEFANAMEARDVKALNSNI